MNQGNKVDPPAENGSPRRNGSQSLLATFVEKARFLGTFGVYLPEEIVVAAGIPYLSIESDYSPDDVGQLQTRIVAFLEQIGG